MLVIFNFTLSDILFLNVITLADIQFVILIVNEIDRAIKWTWGKILIPKDSHLNDKNISIQKLIVTRHKYQCKTVKYNLSNSWVLIADQILNWKCIVIKNRSR